ncbi:unnamed protein product [Chironomus riparius]|uniref:Peptidase S1 domain-containing protein n=1 Tax=Chironomus riparius TaxID=315576 RepID=A0A9N9S3P1_9DIPT|nr:unnamed protein product [Chironomus riparius]
MRNLACIVLILVTITNRGTNIANAEEEVVEVELEWNWEAGVPHYPHPKYSDDDEVLFFPRIIGGTPAFHGEFLAKISLQTRRGHHFCGGSIIDLRHVLTAAHCLTELDGRVIHPNDIRLMGDDLSIDSRGARTRQIRFATHIFAYPNYHALTLENDIAVVRVSVAFHQTPTLQPMPRSRMTPNPNEVCQLAGWGVIHEDRNRPHPVLLRVELDVISMDFCNGTSSYNGLIPANTICAGTMDGSRDACFGDSGGGLICSNQIAGVVSFGFGCGRRNFPGIYADVSRYNVWINECIDSNLPHEDIPRPPIISNSVGKFHPPTKYLLVMIAAAVWMIFNKV